MDLEARLVALWREVLQRDVGRDDDFFDLGGDSLAAVRIAATLEEWLGQPCSPAVVLDYYTPRLLAQHLSDALLGPS